MENYDQEIEKKYHPENFRKDYICSKCGEMLVEEPEVACPKCGELTWKQ